jgi:hypothetical protein
MYSVGFSALFSPLLIHFSDACIIGLIWALPRRLIYTLSCGGNSVQADGNARIGHFILHLNLHSFENNGYFFSQSAYDMRIHIVFVTT